MVSLRRPFSNTADQTLSCYATDLPGGLRSSMFSCFISHTLIIRRITGESTSRFSLSALARSCNRTENHSHPTPDQDEFQLAANREVIPIQSAATIRRARVSRRSLPIGFHSFNNNCHKHAADQERPQRHRQHYKIIAPLKAANRIRLQYKIGRGPQED